MNTNDQLTYLLKEKDFDQLTTKEQAFVLLHYSPDEYQDMRLNLLAAQSIFAEEMTGIEPDEELLTTLLQEDQKKAPLWYRIKSYKLSAPSVAAIIATLFAFQLLFMLKGNESKEQVSGLTQRDTVYITKELHHYDTVYIARQEKTQSAPVQTTEKPQKKQSIANKVTQQENPPRHKLYIIAQNELVRRLQKATTPSGGITARQRGSDSEFLPPSTVPTDHFIGYHEIL